MMEYWFVQMDKELSVVRFHTSLLFADDMLIFYKASRYSFETLNMLDALYLNISLSINKGKSKLSSAKVTSTSDVAPNYTT